MIGKSSMASISSSPEPAAPCHVPTSGTPAWDLALLYPLQGAWSQEEYLSLTDHTRWLVEYTAGTIEVLPMPTIELQLILKFLFRALDTFIERERLGVVLFAPTRVYLDPDKYREPDIVYTSARRHAGSNKRFYQGADLVIEVVSEDADARARDFNQKSIDYAGGGIPEYWIVDPHDKAITVLSLAGNAYRTHGKFGEGEVASSKLLIGFSVAVTDVFQAAKT
jgi:Uma2 family endonuclease